MVLDKHNGFRFSIPAGDVVIIITEIVYNALDKNGDARVVPPDISMVFGILFFKIERSWYFWTNN